MTVNELIAALAKCDGNATVYRDYAQGDEVGAVGVITSKVVAGNVDWKGEVNIVELL